MKHILMTAVVAVLCLAAPAGAQALLPADAPRTEALKALDGVRASSTPEQSRALGFEKSEELSAATVDAAGVPVYMIRLDELRQYKGQEASQLLVDLQTFVYTVSVAGQPRTTVEVRAERGQWITTRIGGANKARLVDAGRRSTLKATGLASSDLFEVRIPALNLIFLGHHDAAGLKLTPLVDDDTLALKTGRTEPAEKVLARLMPRALLTPESMP